MIMLYGLVHLKKRRLSMGGGGVPDRITWAPKSRELSHIGSRRRDQRDSKHEKGSAPPCWLWAGGGPPEEGRRAITGKEMTTSVLQPQNLDVANNLNELGNGLFPRASTIQPNQAKVSLGRLWPETPSVSTWSTELHNCEIISMCCFKLLKLW